MALWVCGAEILAAGGGVGPCAWPFPNAVSSRGVTELRALAFARFEVYEYICFVPPATPLSGHGDRIALLYSASGGCLPSW